MVHNGNKEENQGNRENFTIILWLNLCVGDSYLKNLISQFNFIKTISTQIASVD